MLVWPAVKTLPTGQPGPAARVLRALVRVYQRLVSPLLGPVCRFHPSCSEYTSECLRLHGALGGAYLGARRILRCHPFNPGGFDPPPLPGLRPTLPGIPEGSPSSLKRKRFEARGERC